MRRLPVYLLIDTSGSMRGDPIESVNVGLEAMLQSLRTDPFALESAWISVITFDREVKLLFDLTPLDEVRLPQIDTPDSGPTHMGAALQLLCERMDSEVVRGNAEVRGDWLPLVFLMTDGKPSDLALYNEMVEAIQHRLLGGIIACAAGVAAKTEPLIRLTDRVYGLDTMDSAAFKQFFQWVSHSIGLNNRSLGTGVGLRLPPPPKEVNIIV